MILEIATLDIKEGSQEALKEAFQAAKLVVSQSKGFISVELHQCIEVSTKFNVFIYWETLEDHTIGFRQSPLFIEWRAILSPFFQNPPVAEHFNLI
ncbi:hypothetical protein EMA8858_00485 [Emticicia aquatica]|jgi:heme-degrading monooxygenase HmoA|uniref:ABM domain-containing protein n=1 Tax=Emticicia aquatica TaxID=1681835 RepID=A0ABM9AKZ0_9BACT|nr:antibiotic biosynthesis monooxygenase [Emticicia aquatica]CAH0994376.1 hypothetical protein EMA8858_00485 [Emticicia aquatica]